MKGRKGRIISKILIFGTLAIVLLIGISDNSLGDAITYVRSMNPVWVVLAIAAFMAHVLMDAVALRYFLSRRGYRVSMPRLFFISIAGQYYSNITPGASGGQPMQIYYLHEANVPSGIGTSAISMRFFCFQAMLSVFATFFWIRYGGYINEHVGTAKWVLIIGFVYNAVMVTSLTILALQSPLIKRLIAFGIRVGKRFRWIRNPEEVSARLNSAVDVFHDSLTFYRDRPLEMAVQLAIGGLQLLLLMSVIYCVYRGLGLTGETYGHLVALNVMEFISAAYTPLPGASGAQEGVFSMYFRHVFPDGMLFAALLLWRFFTYYFSMILGAVTMLVHGLRSGQTLREAARQGNEVMDATSAGKAEGDHPEES